MNIEQAREVSRQLREDPCPMDIEAADTIDALIAENELLASTFGYQKGKIEGLQAELATLQAKVATLHKAKGRYHNQIAICDLYDACGLFNVRPISDARS